MLKPNYNLSLRYQSRERVNVSLKIESLSFDSNPVPDVVGQTAFHNLCTGTVFRPYGSVHVLLKPEKQRNEKLVYKEMV
jgi:hypothetical protein